MSQVETQHPSVWVFLLIGAGAGLLSGVFGIGGGVLIVPFLVAFAGFAAPLAAGTSLAAILPTAVVGTVVYASQGSVNWLVGVLLAVGVIGGAQVGAWLLSRITEDGLRVIFAVFLLATAVSLWFVVPARDSVVDVTVFSGVALVFAGLITGVLSGLLGLGGGVIFVPVLIFFFGANDLVAKGTSLFVLVPSALSGTLANISRGKVHLRAAVTVGLAACVFAPPGALLATLMTPFVSNVLFSVLLVMNGAQMLLKRRRK